MAAATDVKDAWTEIAYISIATKGQAVANEVNYTSITSTIDPDLGEKGGESIAVLSGGRVWKFNPQEDTTITLEAYPTEIKSTGSATSRGFFDLMHPTGTGKSGVDSVANDRDRQKIRLNVLWTDSATITGAQLGCASQQNSQRMVFAEGYVTSIKPSQTDGILKYTITMKFPPFDKAGNATMTFWSVTYTTTAAFPGLSTYTGTTYW